MYNVDKVKQSTVRTLYWTETTGKSRSQTIKSRELTIGWRQREGSLSQESRPLHTVIPSCLIYPQGLLSGSCVRPEYIVYEAISSVIIGSRGLSRRTVGLLLLCCLVGRHRHVVTRSASTQRPDVTANKPTNQPPSYTIMHCFLETGRYEITNSRIRHLDTLSAVLKQL